MLMPAPPPPPPLSLMLRDGILLRRTKYAASSGDIAQWDDAPL
jgi:hypothetical protein